MNTSFSSKQCTILYVVLFLVFWLIYQEAAYAQQLPDAVDIAAASKLEETVLRRPRAGTALDVYCSQLRGQAQSGAGQNGQRWCVLGLIESQRGNDFAAIESLSQAEAQMPQDAMVSYYLARSHNYVGNRQDAMDALRRSIDRKPSKLDVFPIFDLLGTLYLRTQQFESADTLWSRIDSMFPGDEQIQDRIIALLAQEGALTQAIARCEKQITTERNANRRIELELQSAELFAKFGQQAKAIERFESVLAHVNPDSWRARDVHHKIELLFKSQNDHRGWIEYAQRQASSHPEDLELRTRLAHALAKTGRETDANTQFLSILSKVPTNTNVRSQYAEFLMLTHRTQDAVTQFEQLTKLEPNIADWRVQWGAATASLFSDTNPSAHDQAESIWLDIIRNNPSKSQSLMQVATYSCKSIEKRKR